jgi:ABC-type transport system involved in multi-copper enzyme maturation permease subunit
MRKAGGMIALFAGLYGVIAALITLIVLGGVGAGAKLDDLAICLGWCGVVFSFAAAVLGAICIFGRSSRPALLLIFNSLLGAVFGVTPVSLCMAAAFIGGLLAFVGGFSRSPSRLPA